ncbi:MAG: class I adenylate-forming enzyme family protein [Burkholderiaceae bacterium]
MGATVESNAGFVPFPAAIAAQAGARPGRTAFQVEGAAVTWQTLHERVTQAAQALVAEGVQPGDRVAIIGFASLAYIDCFFGAIAARACVVPLPASASAAALRTMLQDSGARILFIDPDTGDGIAALGAALAQEGLRVVTFGEGGEDGADYLQWRARGSDAGTLLPEGRPEDPLNIIYSSGTTGTPKGIVHSHGMRQRQASRKGFAFSAEGSSLLSTPMYSNTTIMPMLGSLANGGTTVLMRKFDAGRFLAMAATHRVTHTMLVPVQYKRILAHAQFTPAGLSSLTLSQSTGAPMDAALKREIIARWPGRFLEVYGLTEGGVSCFLEPALHPDKLHTVGKPGHGTEVFLIDEAGRRLPEDQPGQTGELVGRSPFMMAGYHNRPDADAEIRWHDEAGHVYHRTGDIGRFDADGFLVLLDRKKDVIISGGNNIYAADLEAVLLAHADVLEAAVIGVPSADWGETPLALVVAKPGARLEAEALRTWANAQVGKTQRLSAIELRDELPHSALGKLSKKELRAPYWRTPNTLAYP